MIEENLEKPTIFIQDGGYLLTNQMLGDARLPALVMVMIHYNIHVYIGHEQNKRIVDNPISLYKYVPL